MPTAETRARGLRPLVWPLAGISLGIFVAFIPSKSGISLATGIAAWCIIMLLVFLLPVTVIGARVAAVLAGMFGAVPCFVVASPVPRGLLACAMAFPILAAAGLALVPPIPRFRARLAHLLSVGTRHGVHARARHLDLAAVRDLVLGTAAFAVLIALAKAVSPVGLGLMMRWLASGLAIFALAEMATGALPLMTAACGVRVPPFMRSPFRSTSIAEFWSRRWNLWASEILFRRCCFDPLARRSVALAIFAAFFASAVGHALLAFLVLGRWTIAFVCGAFFLAQPLLIAFERWINARRWPIAAQRVWALSALAVTSPLIVEPVLQLVEPVWGPPGSVLAPTLAALGFILVLNTIVALAALVSVSLAATELIGRATSTVPNEQSHGPRALDR
jgi:hypothetical protein